MSAIRLVGAAEVVVGGLMLGRPVEAAAMTAGDGAAPPSAVVRLLATRMVLQGAVLAFRPGRLSRRLGVAADGLHALSMVCVAAWSPQYRRSATSSAAVATATMLLTWGAGP